MLCKNPFMDGSVPYGCGQCNPCRINTRRKKKNRLIFEEKSHSNAAFITLTYDDKHLPTNGSLNIRDYQLFLKRIRKHYAKFNIHLRFLVVGEYGEETFRPHYHFALFGAFPCINLHYDAFQRKKCTCEACSIVKKCWTLGDSDNAYLTPHSAEYIAGYVTKKLTKKEDDRLLRLDLQTLEPYYLHPEFARSSLRPGLGALAMDEIADSLMTDHGCDLMLQIGDVPHMLKHGSKNLPLDRYLKSKLRERLGHDKKTPDEVLQKRKTEMHELFKNALGDQASKNSTTLAIQKKNLLIDINKQNVLNLETKTKLYKKGHSL